MYQNKKQEEQTHGKTYNLYGFKDFLPRNRTDSCSILLHITKQENNMMLMKTLFFMKLILEGG